MFEGTIFEFNRVQLVRVVAALALILVVVIAARRAKVVPGRLQNVVEMVFDFVRVGIVEEVLGAERGAKYTPMLTAMFCAILAFNITGSIAGLNLAGTAVVGLPILLAVWTYVVYLWAGVREKGVGGYLKSSLFPPGVPAVLYILLTPIEILQVFVLRPATLALRLMANMVSGHLMLVLCFLATQYLIFEAAPALKGLAVVTFVGGFVLTLFEIFVAALQAYIFVVLSAVYIGFSVEDEH